MKTPKWALQIISDAKNSKSNRVDLNFPGWDGYEKLSEIPIELLEIPDLEWLSLRDNSFMTVSETITRFKHLRMLDFGNNKFADLPGAISELKELQF